MIAFRAKVLFVLKGKVLLTLLQNTTLARLYLVLVVAGEDIEVTK